MATKPPPGTRGQWTYVLGNRHEWDLVLSSKDKGSTCQVRFCRSPKRTIFSRGKHYVCTICEKCKSRRWRANHPVAAAYHCIKDRAKRRSQLFAITLAHLEELCIGSNYPAQRGRRPNALHIDRKIPSLGYVPGNLQILTAHDNTSKRHTHDYL